MAVGVPIVWLLVTSRLRLEEPFGLLPLTTGFIALTLCVRDFYVRGQGTLAPWSPPERLVAIGLYRYTRNPMYVAVTIVLLGWAVTFNSMTLLVYALTVAIAFHLRVVLAEEPWLARRYGNEWEEYANRVPRWFWPKNPNRFSGKGR